MRPIRLASGPSEFGRVEREYRAFSPEDVPQFSVRGTRCTNPGVHWRAAERSGVATRAPSLNPLQTHSAVTTWRRRRSSWFTEPSSRTVSLSETDRPYLLEGQAAEWRKRDERGFQGFERPFPVARCVDAQERVRTAALPYRQVRPAVCHYEATRNLKHKGKGMGADCCERVPEYFHWVQILRLRRQGAHAHLSNSHRRRRAT